MTRKPQRTKKNPCGLAERDVRREIRALLKRFGFLAIPYVPGIYGNKGVSDLLCIGEVDGVRGRFVAIEIKRPGGKVSPAQREFIETVRAYGGIAFIAASTQDVIDNLRLATLF